MEETGIARLKKNMRYLSILAFTSLGAATLLAQAPPPGGPPGGMRQGDPRGTFQQFLFRIPLAPGPVSGPHSHVPPDFVGAFLNGVPIPNQFEGASYRGQNMWHFDPIARGGASPGLIEKLIPGRGRRSPIIGFAFDGHPIYGTWAFAGSELRRMRSSYKVRDIKVRDTWPDSTRLAPGQYGPAVDAEFPLGTFVEDYDYAANSGDLDEYNGYNGKFAVTPEYPDGSYAYFLTTGYAGRLGFPDLLAHEYFGKCEEVEDPARPRFRIPGAGGRPIRHLEYVHERPLHLMIVSEDLSEFHHVHPEVAADSAWEVSHTFGRSGRHRLYLEFTPPGSNRRVEFVDVLVDESGRRPAAPTAAKSAVLTVSLDSREPLRANEDIELSFDVRDPETGGSVRGLQPYLGASAHFVLVKEGLGQFIHAHPLMDGESPIGEAGEHSHTAQALGPPPRRIRVLTSFPEAGSYKLWAQLQVSGKMETVPFSSACRLPNQRATLARSPLRPYRTAPYGSASHHRGSIPPALRSQPASPRPSPSSAAAPQIAATELCSRTSASRETSGPAKPR